MGVDFPANAVCDKCKRKTIFRLVIDKMKPNVEIHLKMPDGWMAATRPESGELFITCPSCVPVLVSIPPAPPSPEELQPEEVELIGDPATDPTMLSTELHKPNS